MNSNKNLSANEEHESTSDYHAKVSYEHIQKKKKIVSDLMALRRMKYQQQGRQGSPFNFNISPLPDIEVDHITSKDVEPVLQDTILREELSRIHGKEALKKAAEHFSVLSNYADALDKKEEAETKRVKFVSGITQRRKLKMERDRQKRMNELQKLMNKQINLTEKELTLLSKRAGDSSFSLEDEVEDLPTLVENTEKNLKSMERSLRILKIKYANELLAQFREKILKAEMESLKTHHPEGYEVSTWIIDEVMSLVYERSRVNEGNLYESRLLEQLLVTDKAQYDKLEFQIVVANANLEVSNAIIEEVSEVLIPEVCEECFFLALITAVYPEDVVVESTTYALSKPSQIKIGSKASNAKLINDSFGNIKQSRKLFRKGLWYHTLTSQKAQLSTTFVPSPSKPEPRIKTPVVDSGDGAVISSENARPKLDTKFGESALMRQHALYESDFWQSYSIDTLKESIPPEKTVAINVASLSNDHTMLALGSYKGDILVYDVLSNFTLIRSVVYHGKGNDSIVILQWSLDSSRLISLSLKGCVMVWSVSFTPYVSKDDINALNISTSTYRCQQLTALCALESSKGDFKLKNGSFAEGMNSNFTPSFVHFHPTISSAASQDSIVVAMENGIIMKCNLTNNLFYRFGSNLVGGLKRNLDSASIALGQPPIPAQKVHKIGQDIEVELFRFHRALVIQLCFVKNCGDMISIDVKLNVARWRHKSEHLNSFGWFVPYKKYQLSFKEEILLSQDNDEVVFEDASGLKKKLKKSKSKKVVEQERKRALRELEDLDIKNRKLWYTDEFDDKLEKDKAKKKSKYITRIYAPPEYTAADAYAGGTRFLVLTYKKKSNLLLKLAYRIYDSSANNAVNMLQSVVSPSGDRIHFVLLYDEYLPRTRKHISFIELDLEEMQLGKIGPIQVDISSERFDNCRKGNAVFFSCSKVDCCAGTEYIVSNIDGDVYVHSLLSGRVVISKLFDKNASKESPYYQFPKAVKQVSSNSKMLFVKPDGDTSYIVVSPLLEDQSYVPSKIIRIVDSSVPGERALLQSTYKALVAKKRSVANENGKIAWYNPEQASRREVYGHRHLPLPLYFELLLNTIIDIVLARATKVRLPQEARMQTWKQDWARMQGYFSSVEQV